MLKEAIAGLLLLSHPVSQTNHVQEAFYNFPKIQYEIEQETEILLTWERKIVEATAYNESEEDCEKPIDNPLYGITASGNRVTPYRTIAAAPLVPFGTLYYIPERKTPSNLGIHVVEDRGGAITEGHIDVYIKSRQEGLSFGRRNIEVYVPHGGSFESNRVYVASRRLKQLSEELKVLSDKLQTYRSE